MSILTKKYFRDEQAACWKMESVLWPGGKPVCTHCGAINNAGRLFGVRSKPSKKNPDGIVRHGLWKCYACRQQFTIKQQTIFGGSHVPMHKLLQLIFLLTRCGKPINKLRISKALELDYWTIFDLVPAIRSIYIHKQTGERS